MINKTVLFGAIVLATALYTPAFAQTKIGVNAAVKGEVTISRLDSAAVAAAVKDPVLLDDEVTSGGASSLQILLLDETTFTIGADCVMTIDRFVYDPDRGGNELGVNVKKGMFRMMSGKRRARGDVPVIVTPTASLGIRGTIIEAVIGPDAINLAAADGAPIPQGYEIANAGATLTVLRGPGNDKFSNDKVGEVDVTSGGKTVTLRGTGYGVLVISKDLPPIGPFKISDATYQFFSDMLRTRPVGLTNFEPFDINRNFLRPDRPSAQSRPEAPVTFEPPNFDWPSGLQGVEEECDFSQLSC